MRPNTRIVAAAVLASLLIFVLFRFVLRPQPRPDGNTLSVSEKATEQSPSETGTPELDTNDLSPDGPNAAQLGNFIRHFRTPIEFYGKVVDQFGDPVSDAKVKFVANDNPSGGKPSLFFRQTDSSGSFYISGIRGLTLSVEVSKPGFHILPPEYSKVTSSGLFDFGLSSTDSRRSAPNNPVTFHLQKPGITEPYCHKTKAL